MGIGLAVNLLTAIPLKVVWHLQWQRIINDSMVTFSILVCVAFLYWVISDYLAERADEAVRRRLERAGRSRDEIRQEMRRRERARWWII
ncbi:hypothetical protein [Actinacidiphila rubida]|uniref:hypothetical protein n=1 Tax=Actinacidiphila rubida TaxID=310780 RepID=UPI00084987FF|nr:hypothetical protein [Actinacidiphila rubida]